MALKKTINYKLTIAEKQLLKNKKVSQHALQDYAPDEIADLLSAPPQRARELQALAEFQSIPSLGINFAEELISQGYYTLVQFKGKSAVELFLMLMNTIAVHGPTLALKIHTACWYIT